MKLNKNPRSYENIQKLFNNDDFIWELVEIASDNCRLEFTYPDKLGQEKLFLDEGRIQENKKNIQKMMGYYDVYVEYDTILENFDQILNKMYDYYDDWRYFPKKDFLSAVKSTVGNMEWIAAEGGNLRDWEIEDIVPAISRRPYEYDLKAITLPKYSIYEELRSITKDVDFLTTDYVMLDLGLQDLIFKADTTLSEFWKSAEFDQWLEENNFKRWEL